MNQVRMVRGLRIGAIFLAGGLFWGCGSSTEVDEEEQTTVVRGSEWVESSHGKLEVPDTTGAFPTAGRRTVVVSFSKETWDTIQANMTTACGATGAATTCTGAGLDQFESVSAWHKADILTDGQTWKSVGIRLRSNSQLAEAWKARTNAFPFRITMDKWEDVDPTIDNQRFYGFQKLSLVSLADDSTLLRHQVASATYRAKGVPAYRSTVVSVRIAHGSGINDTIDAGYYSLREQIDGPMLKRWFSASGGNLYEPSSFLTAADANNTAAFGGDDVTDYSDFKGFMAALHAANRTTAPASWRANLAATFDVDGFINWLAISTVLGDRGGYGNEDGNYALYADQGKLHWMALDLDGTLRTKGSLDSVWHSSEIANGASLIRFVLADTVYCESYKARVSSFAKSELADGVLTARVTALASQLLPAGSTVAEKLKAFSDVRKPIIDASLAAHACPGSN